ncbi:MBL fold metallo-hydrolase [Campylobacter californiensis]|uniref:MBL fold metallo-hydrolase n=1 Tax=Campylobacter californiensis TaxID=1032243 RepID=UPI002AD320F4|nr:MBL fold metallo-hydrolase [Campylobacter sp. RM13119]
MAYVYRDVGALPAPSRFANLHYYKDGQFISPEPILYYPERRMGKVGYFGHFGPSINGPRLPMPRVELGKNSFGEPENFAYYWLGHSSGILELNGARILIDPVLKNGGPLFLVPRFEPSIISKKELPDIDIVLITHDHYDHLEADTIRYLADKARHFIVPLGVDSRIISWGVPKDKITALGWGEDAELFGVKFKAREAVHYSMRWTNDRDKTLWVSYVIEGAGLRLFWSGDSGYGKHFGRIGDEFGEFDVAFLELDASNPGWPNTHMFGNEAVRASMDLKAKRIVPIHWGVFNLGANAWNENIIKAANEAKQLGVRLDVPKQGERYDLNYQTQVWWEE